MRVVHIAHSSALRLYRVPKVDSLSLLVSHCLLYLYCIRIVIVLVFVFMCVLFLILWGRNSHKLIVDDSNTRHTQTGYTFSGYILAVT